jgi:hypothetical protein
VPENVFRIEGGLDLHQPGKSVSNISDGARQVCNEARADVAALAGAAVAVSIAVAVFGFFADVLD